MRGWGGGQSESIKRSKGRRGERKGHPSSARKERHKNQGSTNRDGRKETSPSLHPKPNGRGSPKQINAAEPIEEKRESHPGKKEISWPNKWRTSGRVFKA